MKKLLSLVFSTLFVLNNIFPQEDSVSRQLPSGPVNDPPTDCPNVIVDHPWYEDFHTNYNCWQTVGSYGWVLAQNYDYLYGILGSTNYDTGTSTTSSPAIALPADSTGLRLYWKDYRRSGSVIYYVMISTTDRLNLASYDTIYTGNTSNSYSLTPRSVSLADYAGDTVYIAFQQRWENYSQAFITDVAIYNSLAPVGSLEAPSNDVDVNDTVRYIVHLSQGIDPTLLFTWQSTLLDTTITTTDSILDIVYPMIGDETMTVTVSNAYGSRLFHHSFSVFECDTIRHLPWNEEFFGIGNSAHYNICWLISGWQHNQGAGIYDEDNNIVNINNFLVVDNINNYLITPTICIPSSNSQHLKLWLRYEGTIIAMVSTDGGNSFTDTIYNGTSSKLCLRSAPLSQYTGQTINIKLVNPTTSGIIDRVSVDYDTTLRVNIRTPETVGPDTSSLCIATLRYGDTTGLTFSWHSAVGGIINAITSDSIRVTYPAGTGNIIDTISVVATNTYNSDSASATIRVIDCTPATHLPWRETFAFGLVCWYKPVGSNWIDDTYYGQEEYRALTSNCRGYGVASPQWIMSKAIQIPADTSLATSLFWDVASSRNDYHHNYSIWVSSTGDYTDTTNYQLLYHDTTTHINYTDYDHLHTSLIPYAGQTIHLAFRNLPFTSTPSFTTLYIDNVTVRTAELPLAVIHAPSDVYSSEPVEYAEASLNEGSYVGLTYTWHSTLLDTTITGNIFPLSYSVAGIDTLSLVASNIYGVGTDTAIIQMHYCPTIDSIPFQEPFEQISDFDCWHNWNFGPNSSSDYYWKNSTVGNREVMVSGYYNNPDYFNAWLVTPPIEMPDIPSGLNLDLDIYGSSSNTPSLTILVSTSGGTRADFFTDTIYYNHHSAEWTHIHIPLNNYAGQTINVAFVHKTGLSYPEREKSINIDSLRIGYTFLPIASLTHSVAFVGDTTFFVAATDNCVSDSLRFTWHSTLMDTTVFTTSPNFNFIYSAAGSDTITLVVSNLYGSDTAVAVVNVAAHPLPTASLTHQFPAVVGDTTRFLSTVNDCSTVGLNYTWHSTLLDTTIWYTVDSWSNLDLLTLSLYYTMGGEDTITFTVSNQYGSATATDIIYVYNCNGINAPYYESFEDIASAAWSSTGFVPPCWLVSSDLSSGNIKTPHVVTSYPGFPIPSNILPSKALIMLAGDGSGYSTVVQATLPRVNQPLQDLSIAFDYRFERFSNGILTIGLYNEYLDLFTTVDTITPSYNDDYAHVTVDFDEAPVIGNERIALRWFYSSSHHNGVVVDNIEVYETLMHPRVAIGGPDTISVFGTATISAFLLQGDTTGLEFTWHSSLMDSTIRYSYESNNTQYANFILTYPNVGIDTITLTAVNQHGRHSVSHIVSVIGLPQAALYGPHAVSSGENIVYTASLVAGVDSVTSYSWQSTMNTHGNAIMQTSGNMMSIYYNTTGVDTLTLTISTILGSSTVLQTVAIADCGINTFPYFESFENGVEGDAYCWRVVNSSPGEGWSRRNSIYRRSGAWSMVAQYNSNAQSTDDWLISPAIELPANGTVALRYRRYMGTIAYFEPRLQIRVSTTGRSDTTLFTDTLAISDLGMDGDFWRAHSVSLAPYQGQTIYIAFRNLKTVRPGFYSSENWHLALDDLEFVTDQVPVATINVEDNYYTCDTAVASVTYYHYDNLSYNVRWHSRMADRGLATLMPDGDTLRIVYYAAGIDTISSAVENIYGVDSVWSYSQIYACPIVSQFPYVAVPAHDDNEWHCWKQWDNGYDRWSPRYDYYHHGSSYYCIMSQPSYNANHNPDAWLISPLIALSDSATSITLRWNGFCEYSTFNIEISTTGRSSKDHFSTTLYSQTNGSLYTPQSQNHWSSYSVDLSAYRGDTICVAFHHIGPVAYPYGYVAMDTMWVECDYSAPDTVWYTVQAMSDDTTMGTVDGSGIFAEGSTVTLTATANNGFLFSHWSDGLTSPSRTVRVYTNITLTAFFIIDTSYVEPDTVWHTVAANIIMNNGGNIPDGLSVTGTGNYADSSIATLTANYSDDFVFMHWITPTLDTVYNNPYSFMVTDDIMVSAVFQRTQGIDNVQPPLANSFLSVYPNPVSSMATLVASISGTLKIYDQTGRLISSQKLTQGYTTLDVSHFISGIYLLQFLTDDGTSVTKIIVTH